MTEGGLEVNAAEGSDPYLYNKCCTSLVQAPGAPVLIGSSTERAYATAVCTLQSKVEPVSVIIGF